MPPIHYTGFNDGFVASTTPPAPSILYSTYIGGTGSDVLNAIAVDASGNAWAAGFTNSNNFSPRTRSSVHIWRKQRCCADQAGSGGVPLFSTYLGGGGNDQALGVGVDGNSNAYVTGFTNGNNFPTTSGGCPDRASGRQRHFRREIQFQRAPRRVYSTLLREPATMRVLPWRRIARAALT